MLTADRPRQDALRREIAEIEAWLDTNRHRRHECPSWSKNQGLVHAKRGELCWLRDPDLARELYPR